MQAPAPEGVITQGDLAEGPHRAAQVTCRARGTWNCHRERDSTKAGRCCWLESVTYGITGGAQVKYLELPNLTGFHVQGCPTCTTFVFTMLIVTVSAPGYLSRLQSAGREYWGMGWYLGAQAPTEVSGRPMCTTPSVPLIGLSDATKQGSSADWQKYTLTGVSLGDGVGDRASS
jgi:hypothetical protein